ncbi:MAG: hypothetical protein D6705_02410 [Deltaproteobacteria bacterium]|nr:MAG: hypothetical protein D6705_02410 [Deltaproteobacteria bacterium]
MAPYVVTSVGKGHRRTYERWSSCLVAIVLVVAAGCRESAGEDVTPDGGTSTGGGEGGTGGPAPIVIDAQPEVDVLFVVDDSATMAEAQRRLAEAADAFFGILEDPRDGVDYRIGITTSDNGNVLFCKDTDPEGGRLRVSSCRARPDDFYTLATAPPTDAFDDVCTPVCPETLAAFETQPTATAVDPVPRRRAWIERRSGRTNLPRGVSPADAFRCVVPQGIAGCGFESQLEGMWRAIDRSGSPGTPNFGFRRPGALLAVVVVTDEADCSADPRFVSIFDPDGNRVFWPDPETLSLSSAVCWNAGVSCTGGPGIYDACDPVNKDVDGNEGVDPDDAVLFPVSRYTTDLGLLGLSVPVEAEASEVVFAGIVGVPTDYRDVSDIVYQDAADETFQAAFGIGPGCSADPITAIPPVRIRDVAQAFAWDDGPNLFSICKDAYDDILAAIARRIVARAGRACIDDLPTRPGAGEPELACTIEDVFPTDFGRERYAVPPCEWTCGGAPCPPYQSPDGWRFPTGATSCHRLLADAEGRTPTPLDDPSTTCVDRGATYEVRIERKAPAVPGTRTEMVCPVRG